MDEGKAVFAFGSVWGMNYLTPAKTPAEYPAVLSDWERAQDMNKSTRKKEVELGMAAKSLLRDHAKDIVSASRNDAIPHRGLRNLIVSDPEFLELLGRIEKEADFVHIVTLDSDVDLGGGEIFKEMGELAERHLTSEKGSPRSGIHITATDYVYARDNLFEWFAGALDKVGRKKLEAKGHDAYPGEPGLTISYASSFGDKAREFIGSGPFGPEDSGDPKHGHFKDLVESRQSVEGKNLRAGWRRLIGEEKAPIHRTVSYLTVHESEGQVKGHSGAVKTIMSMYEQKKPIPPELIQSLITSDNYHSLAPDRNNKNRVSDQRDIVVEATHILNGVISENKYPNDPGALKFALNTALADFMKS